MKIFVNVKPNSRQNNIKRIDSTHFEIWTNSLSREGKANTAVINILARHLDVPKSRIKIFSGAKSKRKVIEIS